MTDKRRSVKRSIDVTLTKTRTTLGDQQSTEVAEKHPPVITGPAKLKSGRVIRIDGESCPVVHAHMIVLTRSSSRGSTRVILF